MQTYSKIRYFLLTFDLLKCISVHKRYTDCSKRQIWQPIEEVVFFLELIDGLLRKRTVGLGGKCHKTENKYELLWYLATFDQLC